MTTIELVVALTVLGVAFAIYSSTTLAVRHQATTVRDVSIASDACQRVVETLRGEAFDRLVVLYGADPDDDPGGVGMAPGRHFAIAGLQPAADDADGFVGEILMPETEVERGLWQLRENSNLVELGMPRDLNGDSIIDGNDHSKDYFQLPVCVRARWKGRTGPCRYELYALLVAFRR